MTDERLSEESAEPTPSGGPPKEWEHRKLYERVIDALYSVPSRFRSELFITGALATDLHTLNTALGAAIEQSLSDTLNELRPIWDPDRKYEPYNFTRQPQTFPDVRLRSDAPSGSPEILMGLELKGWFLLSKEGEPSFRYRVSPSACAPADLLVIFPWILSEVVAGRPKLFRPCVVEAKFAAEARNYYWQYRRGVSGEDAAIDPAPHQTPYPGRGAKHSDQARRDKGSNFGRVARSGILGGYVQEILAETVAGIPIEAWQRFFRLFTENYTLNDIAPRVDKLGKTLVEIDPHLSDDDRQLLLDHFDGILEIIRRR